jgi:hypothetical protein
MREVDSKPVAEDRRESPLFEMPLYVRDASGEYVECHGCLGIAGFFFKTSAMPPVGKLVDVKIMLIGLGAEVTTRGRIINVVPSSDQVGVAAKFEDIPFETERIIARWIDMLVHAHQSPGQTGTEVHSL